MATSDIYEKYNNLTDSDKEQLYEYIISKCEKSDNCLIWLGSNFFKVTYKTINYTVWQFMLFYHRNKILNGYENTIGRTCNNKMCISNEHLNILSKLHSNYNKKSKDDKQLSLKKKYDNLDETNKEQIHDRIIIKCEKINDCLIWPTPNNYRINYNNVIYNVQQFMLYYYQNVLSNNLTKKIGKECSDR